MIVFIKSELTGRKRELEVEPDETIESIKVKMEHIESTIVHEYRLLYGGKELSNDLRLSDCNIQNKTILHLVRRLDIGVFDELH